MGKRKIDIERIQSEDKRQVCFSKRRTGLYKKAAELCTLCNPQITILAFSPAGKPFSFGHPSPGAVIERYLTGRPAPTPQPQVSNPLSELERQLSIENQRKKNYWWDQIDVDGVESVEELQRLTGELEDLRSTVLARETELSRAAVVEPITGVQTSIDQINEESTGDEF